MKGKDSLMKKEKLLSSLAATSLVLTQAGQLSVFAEENNNSVIEPETSEKETTTIEKTEKELLQEKSMRLRRKLMKQKKQKKKLKKFMIHTMKALMYLQRQMSIH